MLFKEKKIREKGNTAYRERTKIHMWIVAILKNCNEIVFILYTYFILELGYFPLTYDVHTRKKKWWRNNIRKHHTRGRNTTMVIRVRSNEEHLYRDAFKTQL